MKSIITLILILLTSQLVIAQTTINDYFIINEDRIEVEIYKEEGTYKIKLSKGEESEEFTIGNNVGSFFDFKKQFRNKVYTTLLDLPTPAINENKDILDRIDEEAESTYYSFANNLRILDNLDYKPNTGILKVNERIPVYLKKKKIDSIIKIVGKKKAKIKFSKEVDNMLSTLKGITTENFTDSIETNDFINFPNALSIAQSESSVDHKLSDIKNYFSELDPNSDTYRTLEAAYIKKYVEAQYVEDDIDEVVLTFFVVENVEFEFSKGFLEILKVSGSFYCEDNDKYNCNLLPSFMKKDSKLLFSNQYGIGFSSRGNYKELQNVSLYLNQSDKSFVVSEFENINIDIKIYNTILKPSMYVLMDDLINYDFTVNKLTRDFSPMDQKITVKGGEKVTLTKEETRKILEVEVFSDFEGFDSDSPNGLIQMELSKHFNINTKRKDNWRHLKWLFKGWGVGQYAEIAGGITKIEDKERRLNPERVDVEIILEDNSLGFDSKRYTTPIDIINYSNWNIGTDINALLVDNPEAKYQLHINGGLRFNRTPIQDSISSVNSTNLTPEEYSISFWTFYPEIKIHLLPEERYGFYAMWRPKYTYLTSDRIDFASSADPITGSRRNVSNWVNEFEFKGYVDVGENGQLFLRWRLQHEMGFSANNFTQIQLGFSFYLLGKKSVSNN